MVTNSTDAGHLNRGQSLVAAFRAARITQRPALKTELRESRAALRQQRLDRLAQHTPAAAASRPFFQDPPPKEAALVRAESADAPPADTSIFAGFVGSSGPATPPSEPDLRPGVESTPAPGQASIPDAVEAGVAPAVTTAAVAAPVEAAAVEASAAEAAPPRHMPLSVIGFGPGMMIRLSHLGIDTVADLAVADPIWLRSALGEISRLINIEVWIETARNACDKAA